MFIVVDWCQFFWRNFMSSSFQFTKSQLPIVSLPDSWLRTMTKTCWDYVRRWLRSIAYFQNFKSGIVRSTFSERGHGLREDHEELQSHLAVGEDVNIACSGKAYRSTARTCTNSFERKSLEKPKVHHLEFGVLFKKSKKNKCSKTVFFFNKIWDRLTTAM